MKRLWGLMGLILAGTAGAVEGKLAPYGSVGVGYESNVFQAPSTLVGVADPVRGDIFYRTVVGLDAGMKVVEGGRVFILFDHEENHFSSHSVLNNYGTEVRAGYRQAWGGHWAAGLTGQWENQNERGVDVDGVPLTQTYAYRALDISPRLEWNGEPFSATGRTEATLTYTHRVADYENPPSTPSVQSQDYKQSEIGLRLVQNYPDRYAAAFEYTLGKRDYDDYLARLGGPASVEGDATTDGTRRSQKDHRLTASWERNIRPGTRWEVGAKAVLRDDGYQNYFSYKQMGLYAKGKVRFESRRELSGKISYARRSYDVQTLSLADATKRKMSLLNAGVTGTQPLTDRLKAFLKYDLEVQGSNVKSNASPLQGFTDQTVFAGVSADW